MSEVEAEKRRLVLSPQGQTFGNLFNDIGKLEKLGASQDEMVEYLESKGVTPEEYMERVPEHKRYLKLELGITPEQKEPTTYGKIVQTPSAIIKGGVKAIGETLETIGDIGVGLIGGQTEKNIREVAAGVKETVQETVPVGVQEFLEGVFDPYQPQDSAIVRVPEVLSQAVVGWKAAGVPLKFIKDGRTITGVVKNIGRGGLAEVLAFDEDEKRLANWLAENPSASPKLREFVNKTLVAQEDDSKIEKKAKQFVEGAILGSLGEAVFGTVKFSYTALKDVLNKFYKKTNQAHPSNEVMSNETMGETTQKMVGETGEKSFENIDQVKKEKVIKKAADESKEGEEILSFGTGRPNKDGELLEVKELEKNNANVTPYDLEINMKSKDGNILPAYEIKNSGKALDKQYDTVVANNVIESLPTKSTLRSTLSETSNATKEDGKTILNFNSKNNSKISKDEFEDELKLHYDEVTPLETIGTKTTYRLSKPKYEISKTELVTDVDGVTKARTVGTEKIGYWKRNWTARQGLTDNVFKRLLKRNNRKDVINKEIQRDIKDLQKSIEDDFGKKQLTSEETNLINKSLGKTEKISPEEVIDVQKTPSKTLELETTQTKLKPGTRVIPNDRKNIGTVASISGDNVTVHFRSPEGLFASKVFKASDLKVTKKYSSSSPKAKIDILKNRLANNKEVREARSKLLEQGRVNTVNKIIELRKKLDDFQKEILKTVRNEELKIAIDESIGTYLNRSYEIFNNPNYIKTVSPATIQKARTAIKSLNKNLSEDQIDGITNQIIERASIDKDIGSIGDVINLFESKGVNVLSSRNAKSILKQKKDIIPEVRELLGEVKDPFINYANTYNKMANLIEEYKTFDDIAKSAQREGIAIPSKSPEGVKTSNLGEIFTLGNKFKNPLNNLFSNKEFAQGVAQGVELAPIQNGILKTYLTAKSYTQMSKTVLSNVTQLRNAIGASVQMLANGNFIGLPDSIKLIKNFITNRKLFNKQLDWLLENGVTNSSVDANLIGRLVDDVAKEGYSFSNKIFETLGKGPKLAAKVYAGFDNIFKVISFFAELRKYNLAMKNVNRSDIHEIFPFPKQVVKKAADVVMDTMPNYNMTPRAVKQFRRFPFLGNFITFTAEITRNTKNMIMQSYKDIFEGLRTGDAGLVGVGMLRLGGTATALTLPGELELQSRLTQGIDDEQAQGIKSLVAEYEIGGDLIFNSEVYKIDKPNSDVFVEFTNQSYTNPFNAIREPFKQAYIAYQQGKDVNEIDRVVTDTLAKFFVSTAKPYLDQQMLSEAIFDVFTTIATPEKLKKPVFLQSDSLVDKVRKSIGRVAEPFEPGAVSSLANLFRTQRTAEYLNEESKLTTGEKIGVTPTGRPKKVIDEYIKNRYGVSSKLMNISMEYAMKANRLSKLIDEPLTSFKKMLRDRTITDPDILLDAYDKALYNSYKQAQELAKFSYNVGKIGLTDSDLMTAIIKYAPNLENKEEYVSKLLGQNRFFPKFLSPEELKKALRNKSPVNVQDLADIYQDYVNHPLLKGLEDEQ